MQICNQLPTVEEARRLVADGDKFEFGSSLNVAYGSHHRFKHQDESTIRTMEVEQDEDESVEETPQEATAMYERHNQQIKVDTPIHADLNKTATVKGLVLGALKMQQIFLDANEEGDEDTDEKPLLESLDIHIGGDGTPCNTFILQERLDPETYKDIRSHAGGFHMLLNSLQNIGQRFGDTHLRAFLQPFRDSDKKKDWYLNPGDPNQTLLEQPEMTAPHYILAARQTLKMNQGAEISPVDVANHTLKRAEESDLCMVVLAWLTFVNVSDLIRYCE
jgi:hypothetical protein